MLRSDSVISRTRDALEPQVSPTIRKNVWREKVGDHIFTSSRLSSPHRRHVFYLWHLWRRDLQHRCSCNGDAEAVYASSDSDLQVVGLQSHVNGQPCTGDAMEVEGTSLPDPHDSKRLKRGVPLPDPPSLTSEYSFVSGVLDSCCNHEQKGFAAAYKKWICTVIDQQR